MVFPGTAKRQQAIEGSPIGLEVLNAILAVEAKPNIGIDHWEQFVAIAMSDRLLEVG